MGLRGVGSLVLILLIVLLVFGTKRVRSMGEDLGAALRSFRRGFQETEETQKDTKEKEQG